MGTRCYIGWLNREKYDTVKNLTIKNKKTILNILNQEDEPDDFYGEDVLDYLYVSESNLADECFEISDAYLPSENEEGVTNFFNNLKTQEDFSAYVIDQSVLLKIIKATEKMVNNTYARNIGYFFDEHGDLKEEISNGEMSKETLILLRRFLMSYRNRAVAVGAVPIIGNEFLMDSSKVDTDLSTEWISNSTYFEDDIYELVRIYKSFNWEKNVLLWLMW